MYLRTPRIFFFLLTSALNVITFSLASWGLAVGEQNKKQARETIPGAELHIQNALNVGGAVCAASGVASLLCLAGLFFLFFRHNQPETIKTVRIKEGLFSFALILWIATLIPATVIFATKSGYVTAPGIPDVVIASLVAASGKNLAYKSNTPIRAYVATGWCAFLSTVVNLILVSLEARHVLRTGVSDGVRGELVGQHTPKHAQSINEKSNLDHHEHQDEIRSEKMASVASTGTTGTHEANTGVNNGTSNIGNEGVRTGELHTAEKLV